VDESENQIAIFGRRGACPFNRDEVTRFYLRGENPFSFPKDPSKK
jgi:hypothetical protein